MSNFESMKQAWHKPATAHSNDLDTPMHTMYIVIHIIINART